MVLNSVDFADITVGSLQHVSVLRSLKKASLLIRGNSYGSIKSTPYSCPIRDLHAHGLGRLGHAAIELDDLV